jgi:hypothetical protein
MGRNESANAGPIGAQFSSSKGLDFRCKRSVSVGMSMRAF